jgi:bifunctional enzyme Fae/Hps
MEDTGKIFGPAQAAVAKAVADAAEEGIIPTSKLDEWVIIASVFIHPQATDYRKIYQYNYGATKNGAPTCTQEVPILRQNHLRQRPRKTPNHGL